VIVGLSGLGLLCLRTRNLFFSASRRRLTVLFCTLIHVYGKTADEVENRPFFATKDGHGKAVLDIFA
jgi:hypothetical protein